MVFCLSSLCPERRRWAEHPILFLQAQVSSIHPNLTWWLSAAGILPSFGCTFDSTTETLLFSVSLSNYWAGREGDKIFTLCLAMCWKGVRILGCVCAPLNSTWSSWSETGDLAWPGKKWPQLRSCDICLGCGEMVAWWCSPGGTQISDSLPPVLYIQFSFFGIGNTILIQGNIPCWC